MARTKRTAPPQRPVYDQAAAPRPVRGQPYDQQVDDWRLGTDADRDERLPTRRHGAAKAKTEQPTGRTVRGVYDREAGVTGGAADPLTPVFPTRRADRKAAGAGRSNAGTDSRSAQRRAGSHVEGYEAEEAPARPLRDRGHARRRRARRRRAVLVSTLLVLAVAVWVMFVFVFKISVITVEGDSIYNDSVVLDKFGYSIGDNLFSFSGKAAAESIAAQLPYLETVSITRMPPGQVTITVTPSVETYCFVTEGEKVITSPLLKVLRTGDNTGGLLEIVGAGIGHCRPGEALPVTGEEKTQAVQAVLQALQSDRLHNCSVVDVSDIYGITVRCENRFEVRLGTTVELDYKLQLAAQTIYGQLDAEATGVVDVSSASTSHAAYYTPGQI